MAGLEDDEAAALLRGEAWGDAMIPAVVEITGEAERAAVAAREGAGELHESRAVRVVWRPRVHLRRAFVVGIDRVLKD